MLLRFFFLLITLSLFAGNVRADDYAKPTWPDLVRTLLRFNAIAISEPNILDEYAIVTECDLYTAFYHDDFKWKRVREAVVQSVQNNLPTYPTKYRYDAMLQLDRYDFKNQTFRFTEKSAIHHVNAFGLYMVEGTGCGVADVKSLPRSFRAILPAPLTLDGLQMSETDGKVLLKQMNDDNNVDRIIYARFNLRLTHIDPLHQNGKGSSALYGQTDPLTGGGVRLDARLDSVDFYEDAERTHPIYHYQP